MYSYKFLCVNLFLANNEFTNANRLFPFPGNINDKKNRVDEFIAMAAGLDCTCARTTIAQQKCLRV